MGNGQTEALVANRKRVCRQIAGVIVTAMGSTDTSFEDMDTRLGYREGRCCQQINQLLAGESIELGVLADMCTAMGAVEIHFTLVRRGSS